VLPQGVPELLDVGVLGVERRLGRKHVGFHHGVPGVFELPLDLLSGHLKGVAVGDHDYGAVAEVLPEDIGD
jgi:hypothetical protein